MTSRLLSKSKYLNGLQCHKYLWTVVHEPESIPVPDAGTQYRFDQGRMVGDLAKKLYPDGIDIPVDDFMGNIKQTKELFAHRLPLFEAGILAGSLYCRLDILNPSGTDQWDIIEVKSSTSVKEVNIHDLSFQKFCCEASGLSIRKCFLAHINNQYVKNGEIDPVELFTVEDVTGQVEEATANIRDRIDNMLEIFSAQQCPDITIGRQCDSPYECPMKKPCWDFLADYSIFSLYYGGNRAFELFDRGIVSIRDIPADFKLNGKQRIQRECVISGVPYVDREALRGFLGVLQYPLYYMDFETFTTAVPLFNSTRPYQQVPFQFSLHIVRDRGATSEHFSFLAEGPEDPRLPFLTTLRNLIGDTGSIVVYNKSFEMGILHDLGDAFPEYSEWINGVCDRMVDLLVPFKNFHYHHPLQMGSASLKYVLPAVTGKSYQGMDIANGEDASMAYLDITYGAVPTETVEKVRADLLRYCKLDTEGMVWIVEQLHTLCNE
jgi:hypothetical protein